MKQTTAAVSRLYKLALLSLLAFSFCMGTAYAGEVACPQIPNLVGKATLKGDHQNGDALVCTYTTAKSTSSGIVPVQSDKWAGNNGQELQCDLLKSKCEVNTLTQGKNLSVNGTIDKITDPIKPIIEPIKDPSDSPGGVDNTNILLALCLQAARDSWEKVQECYRLYP